MMEVVGSARSAAGRRVNNEDACCAEPGLGLFAVADGMGGYEGGEVASQTVIATLLEIFWRLAQDDDVTLPFALDPKLGIAENLARVAVRAAHEEVVARRIGRLASMGSTVAALVVRDGKAVVAHVGDSRVYRLRGRELRQLTADHSLYGEMQRAGAEVPSRENCGYLNVITRAVGLTGGSRPDLVSEPARPGDVYLLCTDGLIEAVSDERIAEVLASMPPDEAAETLVAAAIEQGSRDNVTVVVVAVR
jgi:serine/threonine protein phosphatase PrpC